MKTRSKSVNGDSRQGLGISKSPEPKSNIGNDEADEIMTLPIVFNPYSHSSLEGGNKMEEVQELKKDNINIKSELNRYSEANTEHIEELGRKVAKIEVV